MKQPQADQTEAPLPSYRPNVAAIIRRADGMIFIGERDDVPGCWQFPQGGIDPGEASKEAIRRELREEVSLKPGDYTLSRHLGPYRYLFGNGRRKKGYDGQEQIYFLVDLPLNGECKVNIKTKNPEFRAGRWVVPEDFCLDWLPPMKREVYRQVFIDFFGITLEQSVPTTAEG